MKYLIVFLVIVNTAVVGYALFYSERSKVTTKHSLETVDKTEETVKSATVFQEKEQKGKDPVSMPIKKPIVDNAAQVEVDSATEITEPGEGLTLEAIENMNVSEAEKERMRDDLAYFQSMQHVYHEKVSEEEILKMIAEDAQTQ